MSTSAPARESSEEGLRAATRGTALNLLGAVVTTIAGFGSLIVVANAYDKVLTGVLFTAVGLFTLLALAAKVGTEQSMTWFVAHARAGDRRGAIAGVVRSALNGSTIVAVLVALIAAALAGPLADVLTDEPDAVGDLRILLLLLALSIPPWTIAQASLGAMRGFGTMRSSVVIGSLLRPGVQFVVLAVLVVVDVPLWALGFAWTAAGTASMVAGLVWLRRRIARIDAPAEDARAEFWGHARPRAVSDVLSAALERLDLILVGALAGSAAAGSYAAANRLVLAGQLMMVAMAQAVAPQVASRLARNEISEAQVVVQRITTWSVLMLWPVLATMAVAAPGVMRVFGSDFSDTATVVAVLSAGLALVVSFGPGDTVLLMTGDSRGSLHNHIAALATMVLVAVVAIPPYGAMGAAVAWVASRAVLRLLAVWRIRLATGIRSVGIEVPLAACVATLAYVPLGVALRLLEAPDLYVLFTVAICGSVAYAAIVWWLRRELAIDGLLASIRRT